MLPVSLSNELETLNSPSIPDLPTLVGLFFADPAELGQFEETTADQVPQPYRRLLDHSDHMTVTLEAFHGCPVEVEALNFRTVGRHYCRTSLLRRRTDGRIVQFGVVRLDKSTLPLAAQQEIESRQKPLGRVLIEHNVLREVELSRLWRIRLGPTLKRHFLPPESSNDQPLEVCYGRTALIYCNGEPAVELLEIVTPAGTLASAATDDGGR